MGGLVKWTSLIEKSRSDHPSHEAVHKIARRGEGDKGRMDKPMRRG